jgi:Glutathione S-transferase, N-terminal domain
VPDIVIDTGSSACLSESFTASKYAQAPPHNRSFETLFETDLSILQQNARSTVLLAVAKANNLDVELVETKPPVQDIEYFKLNPLGKIPTFVGANGYILTETMAIAVYCASNILFFLFYSLFKMSHIINTVIPV